MRTLLVALISVIVPIAAWAQSYPSPSLYHWLTPSCVGKTMIVVGDSTSTEANDLQLYPEMQFYTYPGGPLDSVTIVDGGTNGATIDNFLNVNGGGKNISWVISQAPALVVLSYGLNNFRSGTETEADFQTKLQSAVTQLLQALPSLDIILRVPNTMLSTDPTNSGFVTPLPGDTLAQSAQIYSQQMRAAYLALEGMWPNVVVDDMQAKIFGTTSLPLSAYMNDILHPNAAGYSQIGDEIASTAGCSPRFAPRLAEFARAQAPTNPWSVYPQEVEDTRYYTKIFEGQAGISAVGQGYLSIAGRTPSALNDNAFGYDQYRIDPKNLWPGDLVQFGDNPPFPLPPGISAQINSPFILYIYGMGSSTPPISTNGVNERVTIWRPKFYHYVDMARNIQTYSGEPVTYGYRVVYSGSFAQTDCPSTAYNTIVLKQLRGEPLIANSVPALGDVLIAPGQTPYTVESTATITSASGQITVCGPNVPSWSGMGGAANDYANEIFDFGAQRQ